MMITTFPSYIFLFIYSPVGNLRQKCFGLRLSIMPFQEERERVFLLDQHKILFLRNIKCVDKLLKREKKRNFLEGN